ncbi:MAG: hypothetical protein PSX36_05720 [bacterium]|nr:hypothetical protein [bacterium]
MNYFINVDVLKKPSLFVILFAFLFAFWFADFWRPYNAKKQESNFVWDMFGYYSYLPATFCNERSFLWNGTSGYFLSKSPKGEFFPKYTYGLSILHAPFFAIGYKLAINQKDALDGFSEPFSTAVRWGTIFYVMLGLLFLRKFLLFYFSERVTAFTLTSILFGTMLFMYTFVQSEMPHAYLFTLFAIFLYYTKLWHDAQKYRYTLVIAFTGALITLIRPTELFILLFFLFWGVKNWSDFSSKAGFLLSHYKHLLMMLSFGIAIWIPQLFFWKAYTGSYFYFSYQDEKFFWTDPQILNILVSYRKGWITYTPLIILAFFGFFFVKREFPISKWVMFGITFLMVYVYSCWWDWNYGGCFGARAFCQHIAFLSVPIAYFFEFALYSKMRMRLKNFVSGVTLLFVFSCIFLNIGQTYQYQELRKIHGWAMTKQAYWDVFRKYQFTVEEGYKFWADLKFPEHDNWKKGQNRDDR